MWWQVVAEEARESYKPSIYTELESNTADEMENNAELVKNWVDGWKPGLAWSGTGAVCGM